MKGSERSMKGSRKVVDTQGKGSVLPPATHLVPRPFEVVVVQRPGHHPQVQANPGNVRRVRHREVPTAVPVEPVQSAWDGPALSQSADTPSSPLL